MSTSHSIQTLYHYITGMLLYSILALSPVQAETTNCTAITSLPYVITTQGVYCFTDHLSTNMASGNAIEIQTNNVTIDMNGFKLGGLAAGTSTLANGIYAYQRKNITIRNGTIRGFYRGIYLGDAFPYTTSQGHVVRGILADQNTYMGILVEGRGMTLRGNKVVDTGGSTIVSGAHGIQVGGPGNNILDNQVSTTTAVSIGLAYGIYLSFADNSMVKDNRLSEVVASGTGVSFAIYIDNSNDVMVRNNMISVAYYGVFYLGGSTGLYGGNYTSGVTVPFSDGTAAGGTNYTNP